MPGWRTVSSLFYVQHQSWQTDWQLPSLAIPFPKISIRLINLMLGSGVGIQRPKEMFTIEYVYIYGLSNVHTFEPNISLIRFISLMLYCAKP